MIVNAHLRERGSGQLETPSPEQSYVQVEAGTYEAGRDHILAEVLEG